VYFSELSHDEVILRFPQSRPFALHCSEHMNVSKLSSDIEHLTKRLALTTGDVLLDCKGRYAFSVILLAAWLSGRKVVLPPNSHQATLEYITRRHNISTILNDDALQLMPESKHSLDEPCLELRFKRNQEALIIYTSGSSGEPKPVQKNIGNLFSEVFALRKIMPTSDKPLVASVPPNHLYGLTFTILLPWVLGVAVVDECPLHASEVLETMGSINAEVLITVPVHLKAMLEQDIACAPSMVIASAGRLDQPLAEQWYERFGYEITEVYGSSETGVVAHRKQLRNKLWQPFSLVMIDQHNDCLQVSSPFIHESEGKLFQSKDKVRMQAGGFELYGRADAIVKIAGKRISLVHVENAIKSCAGIEDAAVIAVPVNGHIRDIAIWAVAASARYMEMNSRDLRLMLQSKLDGVEMPRRILLKKTLPREMNGKLRRDSLLALFEGH